MKFFVRKFLFRSRFNLYKKKEVSTSVCVSLGLLNLLCKLVGQDGKCFSLLVLIMISLFRATCTSQCFKLKANTWLKGGANSDQNNQITFALPVIPKTFTNGNLRDETVDIPQSLLQN